MIKICLDAGHGKDTPGKRSPDGKLLEYEFNRQMVKIVANKLKEYKDQIEVVFTQPPEEDYDLSLSRRANNANLEKADYFVSIHANAYDSYIEVEEDGKLKNVNTFNSAKGFEIYVVSKGGKAEKLANSIMYSVKNKIPDIVIRGLKVADFTVLKNTNMPAILIESGFMTNRDECIKLLSEDYRMTLGESYVSGILNYLGIKENESEENVDKMYKVQVGSFKEYKNAKRLANELKEKGYDCYIVE